MAKAQRGLPGGFGLDLPEEGPVVLGDYLDDEPRPTVRPARHDPRPVIQAPPPARPAEHPEAAPPELGRDSLQVRGGTPPAPQPAHAAPGAFAPANSVPPRDEYVRVKRPRRREMHLTPETQAMFEALVQHIRQTGRQGDASASEVFQAVVSLLHAAKEDLDLSRVPARGAWGSVSARNYPAALAAAFERAVVLAARKRAE